MFSSLASWCILIKIHCTYILLIDPSIIHFFFCCVAGVHVQQSLSENTLVPNINLFNVAVRGGSHLELTVNSVGSGSVRTPLIRTTRQRSASTLRWSALRCSAFPSACSCKSDGANVDSANCKQENNNSCIHTVVSSFVVSSSHLGCFNHSHIKSFSLKGGQCSMTFSVCSF